MLRCPKCSRIFQDGTQRFCTHDGGRLLPVSEPLRLVNEATATQLNIERNQTGELSFETREKKPRQVISTYKFVPFEESAFVKLEETDDVPLTIQNVQNSPSGRLVKTDGISPEKNGRDDNFVRPSGRLTLSQSNVDSFIGQNIKGRYSLEKIFTQDSTSVTYLANDRVHAERRVMLKVLFFDKSDANFNRRFYEEKVALSHVNHPSIGGVLDAGELGEGKPFVVMEFVEGQSLRQLLQENRKLGATETAKIVRQVAQALSEAHNNRILHRDLKPENIYLKPLETGGEQVKVLNFGIGSETDVRENNDTLTNLEDFVYQSPEQLESKAPSPESDIYALAVIAYEMLTGQKPFGGSSPKSLRESQRRGIKVLPTDGRLELQKEVIEVLSRALAYNPSQRFHLAREFGENFHTALTQDNAPETSQNNALTTPDDKTSAENVSPSTPFQTVSDLNYQAVQSHTEAADSTISPQTQTEKRAAAPTISHKSVDETRPRTAKTIAVNPPLIIAGIVAVLSLMGILGYATYSVLNFMNADDTVFVPENPQNPVNPVVQTTNNAPNIAVAPNEVQNNVENAPVSPQIVMPPDSVQFSSSREEVSGKLSEKFVGFSVAYPSKWQKNGEWGTGNFLDVANRVSTQEPIEQLIVSWYESKGTFEVDKLKFPTYAPLLIRAYGFNDKTKSGIPKLRKVSEGAIKFNGRDAYEVKLEGDGVDKKGKDMKIWLRTVFLPTERDGASSGLTITMLATSFAPALSNVNDVGTKGELPLILETLRLEN